MDTGHFYRDVLMLHVLTDKMHLFVDELNGAFQ